MLKRSTVIISILAAALIAVSIICFMDKSESTPSATAADPAAATYNTIMTRYSVRQYTDQPVEKATVDSLLRAAMAAPTAMNKQPWRFVVITDQAVKDSICAQEPFKYAKMVDKAPVVIAVCADMNATIEGEGLTYWVQDASAATENMLLAAHAMGLGGVWCGVYPINERVNALRRVLALPSYIVPLNLVPIGWPAGEPNVKDKWNPESIHYNKW